MKLTSPTPPPKAACVCVYNWIKFVRASESESCVRSWVNFVCASEAPTEEAAAHHLGQFELFGS